MRDTIIRLSFKSPDHHEARMTVPTRTALAAVALAVAAAACSSSPSNQYGAGGSTGSIQVHDSVTGTPSGTAFTLSVGTATKSISANGVMSFTGLAPGDYTVNFGGTMGNCSVSNGSSQTVTVYAGYVQYLTFITACT